MAILCWQETCVVDAVGLFVSLSLTPPTLRDDAVVAKDVAAAAC